jgi:release factor glutamine methyltransferase
VNAPQASIADLGTGSGAIAIALAHERPGWRVVATDVSDAALALARRNGERLVAGRVEWRPSDPGGEWYAPLAGQRFDALLSNPPYIAGDDPVLATDGLKFEPRGALTPEGDGYAALVARGFTHVTSHRDLAGRERITEGQISHARF